eukprot:2252820-Rhodomonas_salina.1
MRDALEERPRLREWSNLIGHDAGALRAATDMLKLCTKRSVDSSAVRVSRIGTDEVHLNHLETMQQGRWVHSSLISAWHTLLSNNARHVCFASDLLAIHSTWIMDTSFYDLLAS